MHIDDELQVDEVLKVPHPFTSEVNTLKSQVETLSAQQQAAVQKSDSAQEQVKSLQGQVQELTGDNQDLQLGVKLLPWWRATAVSLAIFALVMFGVVLLTLFEWWRMRPQVRRVGGDDRRAQAGSTTNTRRCSRRRSCDCSSSTGGVVAQLPRGSRGPKMPEEVEIERLNEELKQILEQHLQKMGARLPGTRRKGWREMFGGSDVGSTVEARRLSTLDRRPSKEFHHEKIRSDGCARDPHGCAVCNDLASGTRASDTPECCVKKQGCCPSASCCTGGNHGMGAHCMLRTARIALIAFSSLGASPSPGGGVKIRVSGARVQ